MADYYDRDELMEYLTRTKAAGGTPSFTNIPDQVSSKTFGVALPEKNITPPPTPDNAITPIGTRGTAGVLPSTTLAWAKVQGQQDQATMTSRTRAEAALPDQGSAAANEFLRLQQQKLEIETAMQEMTRPIRDEMTRVTEESAPLREMYARFAGTGLDTADEGLVALDQQEAQAKKMLGDKLGIIQKSPEYQQLDRVLNQLQPTIDMTQRRANAEIESTIRNRYQVEYLQDSSEIKTKLARDAAIAEVTPIQAWAIAETIPGVNTPDEARAYVADGKLAGLDPARKNIVESYVQNQHDPEKNEIIQHFDASDDEFKLRGEMLAAKHPENEEKLLDLTLRMGTERRKNKKGLMQYLQDGSGDNPEVAQLKQLDMDIQQAGSNTEYRKVLQAQKQQLTQAVSSAYMQDRVIQPAKEYALSANREDISMPVEVTGPNAQTADKIIKTLQSPKYKTLEKAVNAVTVLVEPELEAEGVPPEQTNRVLRQILTSYAEDLDSIYSPTGIRFSAADVNKYATRSLFQQLMKNINPAVAHKDIATDGIHLAP